MWIHSSRPQEWSAGEDAPKANPLELSTFAGLTFPGTNVFHGFCKYSDHLAPSQRPHTLLVTEILGTICVCLGLCHDKKPERICFKMVSSSDFLCPVSSWCAPSPPCHRTPGITVDMVDDRTKSFLPNALRTNVFYCLQLCIANSSKWT